MGCKGLITCLKQRDGWYCRISLILLFCATECTAWLVERKPLFRIELEVSIIRLQAGNVNASIVVIGFGNLVDLESSAEALVKEEISTYAPSYNPPHHPWPSRAQFVQDEYKFSKIARPEALTERTTTVATDLDNQGGLPVAWIAAIAINSILIFLFIVFIIYCYCKNKNRQNREPMTFSERTENAPDRIASNKTPQTAGPSRPHTERQMAVRSTTEANPVFTVENERNKQIADVESEAAGYSKSDAFKRPVQDDRMVHSPDEIKERAKWQEREAAVMSAKPRGRTAFFDDDSDEDPYERFTLNLKEEEERKRREQESLEKEAAARKRALDNLEDKIVSNREDEDKHLQEVDDDSHLYPWQKELERRRQIDVDRHRVNPSPSMIDNYQAKRVDYTAPDLPFAMLLNENIRRRNEQSRVVDSKPTRFTPPIFPAPLPGSADINKGRQPENDSLNDNVEEPFPEEETYEEEAELEEVPDERLKKYPIYLITNEFNGQETKQHVGYIMLPTDHGLTLTQTRRYIVESTDVDQLVKNINYHFLSEERQDMSLREGGAMIDDTYPNGNIFIKSFRNGVFSSKTKTARRRVYRPKPYTVPISKRRKSMPYVGPLGLCYAPDCEKPARMKCLNCGTVNYCSITCMRKTVPFHKKDCVKPPWKL